MAIFWGIVVVVLILGLMLLGLKHRNSSKGYLEWDPKERMKWRAEMEDVDTWQMLELENANRRQRGDAEVTMEEYEERVRRNRPR